MNQPPSPTFDAVVRPRGVPEDALAHVLTVPPGSCGLRLDQFVKSRLRSASRTRARSIVKHWAYSLDGAPLRPGRRVQPGDRIALWRPAFEDREPDQPLAVLYEDPYLLVVDKPPLLVVHPTASYHRNTVIRRLYLDRPGEYLSLLHRLDRETSGVLMLARSLEADRAFKRVLEEHALAAATPLEALASLSHRSAARVRRGLELTVEKTYLAITEGAPETACIHSCLERDPTSQVKMRVAPLGHGMRSRTSVTVLGIRGQHALVACQLHTGRQHQLRVHLASVGCPIVGDKLYGVATTAKPALARHALHAHRYRILHPFTGGELELVSPLAYDLRDFWDSLPQSANTSTLLRAAALPH